MKPLKIHSTSLICLKSIASSFRTAQPWTTLSIDKETGLWWPKRPYYASDGQDWSIFQNGPYQSIPKEFLAVIEPEKREALAGEEKEKHALVWVSFSPANFGEAQIRALYYWDRTKRKLILEGYTFSHLEEKMETHPKRPIYKSEGREDIDLLVRPYGVFRLPGEIDEMTLLQNMFFPPKYTFGDEANKGNPPTDETHPPEGYNFFDFKRVKEGEPWSSNGKYEIRHYPENLKKALDYLDEQPTNDWINELKRKIKEETYEPEDVRKIIRSELGRLPVDKTKEEELKLNVLEEIWKIFE